MDKIINEPQPGDVLSVNRGLYKHYGVYVGNNTVVHFSGGYGHELSAHRACIRKTTLELHSQYGESVCRIPASVLPGQSGNRTCISRSGRKIQVSFNNPFLTDIRG